MKNNLVLIFLLFSTCIVQAQTPWLHVDGNKIKDPAGNVVILRGVATQDIRGQLSATIGLNGLIDTLTDVDNPASNSPGWYTKVIRFTINAPVPMELETYYTTILKPAVDYATSKGLYVIVDYHHIADVQANDENTKAFWEFMAPKFKTYSNVLYEIYNEPINMNFTWDQFYPYMQSWIDIVRKHAPHNLILAGSPWWDQRMAGSVSKPFTGGNIVYVAHIYPQHFSSAFNRGQVEQTAAVHPVFLSEWGFRLGASDALLQGTITGYGDPIMDWAENLGLSWTAWCADNDWEPAMFTNNWLLRVSENDMGGFVKDKLYEKRNDNQPADIDCIPPFLGANQSICGKASIEVQSGLSPDGKTFRWYKNDVLIDGEVLPSLTVTEKGNYRFEVDTLATGCTMHDEIIIVDTLFPVDLGPDKVVEGTETLIAGNPADLFTYQWYKNGELLDSETSYSLDIEDTCTTTFSVSVSYPGCGTTSDEFEILCRRALFLGAPIEVPGIVQAEYVDIQNVPNLAYYDTDPSNNGGALRSDAIDVEVCTDAGGGYNVGWISTGEWYEYSIHVTDPGTFSAAFRVASPNATGRLYMRANQTNVTGTVVVPNTGGWQTWTTVTVDNITLTAQDTVLRVYISGGNFNLNYINLQKTLTAVKGRSITHNLNLYPNPVTDVLNISGEQASYDWQILNLLGTEMLQGKGKQADVNSLPPGMYILKVDDSAYPILKK